MFEEVQSVIEPYAEPPVACGKAPPRAEGIARQVAGLIARHMPSLRPEHVGSTAVPACGGRGIVDLLVAAAEVELESVHLLLDRLGFQRKPGASFLPELPLRTGAWSENGETQPLHVYVLAANTEEADSMRFLRTCLRADADLTKAYVKAKRKIIAAGITDPVEYLRQKAEFLKMVLS